MKILSKFHEFLETYFWEYDFWFKFLPIDNYTNFMTVLNSFDYSFMKNDIKFYFEYMNEIFFRTSYQKSFCKSKVSIKNQDQFSRINID